MCALYSKQHYNLRFFWRKNAKTSDQSLIQLVNSKNYVYIYYEARKTGFDFLSNTLSIVMALL